jgi:hypothetical protein
LPLKFLRGPRSAALPRVGFTKGLKTTIAIRPQRRRYLIAHLRLYRQSIDEIGTLLVWAREFATQGIRALSVSPGPIKTPFQSAAQSSPELIKQFLDDVPMQRFGKPEEIGELVLFICSDACEFMTADTVYVNGGGGWR